MLTFQALAVTAVSIKGVHLYVEKARNFTLEDAMGGAACCILNVPTAAGDITTAPVVVVSEYLIKYFESDEMEFIVNHEVSHAICKHITADMAGVEINLKKEFEADRMAVLKGRASAAAGISALTKIYHRLKYKVTLNERIGLWMSLYARKRKLQRLVMKGF